MNLDRFALVKELFIRAKDLPEAERRTYLDDVCKDDPELRNEIESLLTHRELDDILRTGAEHRLHSLSRDRLLIADSVFREAVDLPPDEQAPFLTARCGEDPELHAVVAHFLERGEGGVSEFLHPSTKVRTLGEAGREAPSRIGSYEIIRKLGEGGMAVVYEARQKNPRRTVALKVIKGALFDRSLFRRFDLETSIMAKLNHPGIARVYDAGETEEGIPFFAMEHVSGMRLTEYAQEGELAMDARLELMARVCDAVHYAHEVGVIHRDLKPANILVTDEAGSGSQPKVLDFGVARAIDEGLQTVSMHTSTGQLLGTLAYMSPEQVGARSDDLDTRA